MLQRGDSKDEKKKSNVMLSAAIEFFQLLDPSKPCLTSYIQ
jgi:hypothetical protein